MPMGRGRHRHDEPRSSWPIPTDIAECVEITSYCDILLCHGTHQHVLRSRVLHGGLHRDAQKACISFLRRSLGLETVSRPSQGTSTDCETTRQQHRASASLPKKKVCHAATTAMTALVQCFFCTFDVETHQTTWDLWSMEVAS